MLDNKILNPVAFIFSFVWPRAVKRESVFQGERVTALRRIPAEIAESMAMKFISHMAGCASTNHNLDWQFNHASSASLSRPLFFHPPVLPASTATAENSLHEQVPP